MAWNYFFGGIDSNDGYREDFRVVEIPAFSVRAHPEQRKGYVRVTPARLAFQPRMLGHPHAPDMNVVSLGSAIVPQRARQLSCALFEDCDRIFGKHSPFNMLNETYLIPPGDFAAILKCRHCEFMPGKPRANSEHMVTLFVRTVNADSILTIQA